MIRIAPAREHLDFAVELDCEFVVPLIPLPLLRPHFTNVRSAAFLNRGGGDRRRREAQERELDGFGDEFAIEPNNEATCTT
jgi:hypothetical protein